MVPRSAVLLALVALGPSACRGGARASTGGSSGSGGTGSSGTTGTTGTTAATGGLPGACASTDECREDGGEGHCVASYDPATGTMGPATCVPGCLMPADLQAWCIDHESCCPGLLCSTVDGFCYDPSTTGTGTGTGTGGASTG